MKKVVLAVALLGMIAGPAMADLMQEFAVSADRPEFAGAFSNGVTAPRIAGQEVYSNLAPVFGYGPGLNTWVYDDLGLDWATNPTTSTVMDEVTFSIYHPSPGFGTIDTATVDIAFYVDDLVNIPGTPTTPLLGGVTGITFDFMDAGVAGTGLAPGFYATVTVTGLSIDLLGSTDILAGMRGTAITGGATNFGQIGAGNPPALGTSGNFFYSDDGVAPGWSWFGGDPYANFMWELSVPEPGTMALLGLGGMMLLRRRRA